MSTVGSTHKTDECLFAKFAPKNRDRVFTKPGRYVSDRFRSIATVSATAAITTRHPQCPVVTPVGTEGTNTVAVIANADGKRTPSAVLTSQRPLTTGATSSMHQLQHVCSAEAKCDYFFRSPLRHYQSAVLDVFSCSPRFPSTSVRISGVLEGDNIEHQLNTDSATEIPCIAKTLIDYIIIKSFRAKLDSVAERLSLQDGNVTIPATHNRSL